MSEMPPALPRRWIPSGPRRTRSHPEYLEIIRTHLPLVHGAAARLLGGNTEGAGNVTSAVFEAFVAKYKEAPRKPCLPAWLLRTTKFAAAKERKRLGIAKAARGSQQYLNERFLRALLALPRKVQQPFIYHGMAGEPLPVTAAVLQLRERKVEARAAKAHGKLHKVWIKSGGSAAEEFGSYVRGWIAAPAPDLETRVVETVAAWDGERQRTPLAKATESAWMWHAIRQLMKGAARGFGVAVLVLAAVAGTFHFLATHGYLNNFFLRQNAKQMIKEFPELGRPARAWPVTAEDQARVSTTLPGSSADLFRMTNIWTAKLSFTAAEWKKIQPDRVEPVRNMFQDGRIVLRNPKAQRSGLAGVLGMDFNWIEGTLEFGGRTFPKTAVRYRGNGTFMQSLYGSKQSLKVDLNKFNKGQDLAGLDELNFLNSIADNSYLRDALSERLFRDLGVPGPRTSYAYVTLDVPGTFTNQAMGLYVLMENIDGDFAKDRFGTKKTPIFKPVTYELFQDWGGDWKAYADIYDLKTEATPAQLKRVVELAQLTSHATDEEFAAKVPEYLDFENFAAFLAGHVLLSSYDGFLLNGQNFYFYIHPETGKIGFISWDQDHSFGEFPYVGTAETRERASIWEPQMYDFKFLGRVMKVEAFRNVYRQKIEYALRELFTVDRLYKQIDELAAQIRPAVAAESEFRLKRFDQSVSSEWLPGPRDGRGEGPSTPVQQLKRFVTNRVESVRAQLDGSTSGEKLTLKF